MKPKTPETAWTQRRANLETIDRFTLEARVAEGGLLGMRGNLNWRQRPSDFEMLISGPFGVGAVSIAGTPDNVEIRTKKRRYETDDPERFLHDRLGWTLPVTGLRYWVLGLPAPHEDAELAFDDGGHLQKMQQDGWTLKYDDYQKVGRYDLPHRFQLANKEVSIRVVVDAWKNLPK